MSGEPMKIHGEVLKFPVDWEYRIIVEAAREGSVREEVENCLTSHKIPLSIHEGLHSESGRYRTLKVAVTLQNREMMDSLSADLAEIPGVKFLL
ncbi:DUF493 domain-containing protein [uncultured Victivallis sp.]|uniref:DUF493 domain-containing protein n=1 Tax=uncultured Victivallis sp. TaxID=354118 RepID=UPI0025DA093A|nr:DUF493 domain-containing protein [uncultured Victivallis sp.]